MSAQLYMEMEYVCCLFVSSIFILLSQESGAIFWTNPHRLEGVHSRVSGSFLDFFPVNLLHVRSHKQR